MSLVTWTYCFLTMCSVLATNTSCPTWHYYHNATGQCECGKWLTCSSDSNQVDIRNDCCATPLGEDVATDCIQRCPAMLASWMR
ncbi:hypothetical protein GBAR_LOCUS9592 [Geodia barretti]|uniref:Uncharacterized protein n=1 Tax=Geodia barretti TaxID=519541 RepID=A0AA35RPT0_GEOBA|nr:hypothetical protein GBAR_LOCUS9592 [Geodia barretti]